MINLGGKGRSTAFSSQKTESKFSQKSMNCHLQIVGSNQASCRTQHGCSHAYTD